VSVLEVILYLIILYKDSYLYFSVQLFDVKCG